MLKAIYRLRKKTDFSRIYQKKRSYSSSFLWLKFSLNDLSHSRVGVVVSRKVSKKAVERNQIKRRLRALVGDFLPLINSHYDLIITARPSILKKSYQEIAQDLKKLLQRAQLLK